MASFHLTDYMYNMMLIFQEPVIMPKWNTFASSVSGIWKGTGAVFSPITAKMEPIDVGRNNEHQFDCYTLSRIEAVASTNGTHESNIQRTVNWVTLNPHGENRRVNKNKEDASLSTIEAFDGRKTNHVIPKFESFNFETSDVMEEDLMGMEPGLVFFEVRTCITSSFTHVFHLLKKKKNFY